MAHAKIAAGLLIAGRSILAVGQVAAEPPEIFAIVANFKDKGLRRGRRILLSASFALLCLFGVAVIY